MPGGALAQRAQGTSAERNAGTSGKVAAPPRVDRETPP
jgi:hypothetical protein